MKIRELHIEGFESLRDATWNPGELNVIVGLNGAGKSNLLRLLDFIAISAQGKLGKHIQSLGGMDSIVWNGEGPSVKFSVETAPPNESGPERYALELRWPGFGSAYRIESESLTGSRKKKGTEGNPVKFLERRGKRATIFAPDGQTLLIPEEYVPDEESLLSMASGALIGNLIPPFRKDLASIAVYRDFNTNTDAPIRRPAISSMDKRVDPNGRNLVAVMHTLYAGDRDFKIDIDSAMRAAYGDDFGELVFAPGANQSIQLRIRWNSLKREQSVAEISDGALRFLFLLTILASPSLASIIAIDEPETGLHPSMLPLIAEYAADASKRSQVILTTHSPQFLDAFTQIRPTTTVARREHGETKLQTLRNEDLDYWLEEYSLGSLFRSGELEQMA